MSNFSRSLTPDQCKQQLGTFERDYRLNPTNAGCAGNYASVLFTIGRVPESIPVFEQACILDRKTAGNFINFAMALKDVGRYDEAARALEYGYQAEPDSFYHELGFAESLLRAGLWRRAWPMYEEARITKFSVKNEQEIPPQLPELKRENIEMLEACCEPASRLPNGSKPRIAVYGEGGIGDRICYARFLPWLERYGFDFTYFPDAGIVNNPGFACSSLFKSWPWANTRELDGSPFEASAWTTQFALMAIFNITPTQIPWFLLPLKINDEVSAPYATMFRELRRQQGKPIVGVVWNAGEVFEGERKFRSMSHVQVTRLAVSCPQYTWVNCNLNADLAEPFCNVKPWVTWEHTAAIMACCDGIISVDTGPMHVAGAMELPLWIALSGNSDWKFMKAPPDVGAPIYIPGQRPHQSKISRDKCYFYPKARIFRNRGMGFEDTINQLIERLTAGDYPGREKNADVHSGNHDRDAQSCRESYGTHFESGQRDGGNGASDGSQRQRDAAATSSAGNGRRSVVG
jgi:hypothetical protein